MWATYSCKLRGHAKGMGGVGGGQLLQCSLGLLTWQLLHLRQLGLYYKKWSSDNVCFCCRELLSRQLGRLRPMPEWCDDQASTSDCWGGTVWEESCQNKAMLLVLGLLTTHQLLAWGWGEWELGLSLGMFCRLLILFSFCCRFVSQKKGFLYIYIFFLHLCVSHRSHLMQKRKQKRKKPEKVGFSFKK